MKLEDDELIVKYPNLFMEAKNWWRTCCNEVMRDNKRMNDQQEKANSKEVVSC